MFKLCHLGAWQRGWSLIGTLDLPSQSRGKIATIMSIYIFTNLLQFSRLTDLSLT